MRRPRRNGGHSADSRGLRRTSPADHVSRAPAAFPRADQLKDREIQIMRLVAKGLSNAEIGSELCLSESTVKTYVSRPLTTLELRDRVQIAVMAYESDW
ncbi:LuxR C-terminal-related transcriptional regulator [Brevibacterium sp.]|uniref:response regulator transcription factor n=1 Tax=Brevibacterium sp. TaxID=1701 RepID=UPI0028126530|nr:LuxR C-terminal-related transcriptional regulator [Brevibacterium sp.]